MAARRKRPQRIDGPPLGTGARAIWWIEKYCRIPEGKDIGKPVKLRAWQKSILEEIYDNPAGTRQAILSFGRKNAKTSTAAFILLYHLCGDGLVPNSHIYSAAQSRDQASILFGLAAKIVRLSPILAAHVTIRDARKELEFKQAGVKYSALSAEVATAFGLSPVLVIHDELGQVVGPRSDLYDALETATAAHDKPLSIVISTQARHDGDLLSMLIDDALERNDPQTIVRLYTAAPELDPFDDMTIKLANPAFGDFQNADEVRAMAERARRMPSTEASYRNLILNQRISADTHFVPPAIWKACGAEPQPFDRANEENAIVYGGLDLSAVNDLTACVLMAKLGDKWQVKPTFWLPADGLRDRASSERVPYDLWERQGMLETAPGKSVDYEFVATWLMATFQKYSIAKIGFDPWNFGQLRAYLTRAGFSDKKIDEHFVEFGQGYKSMSPALRELEGALVNGRIAHGMHPVLSMCANNAVVQMDPAGNKKLNKARSVRRIDGMVALAMAFGVAHLEPAKRAEYKLWVI